MYPPLWGSQDACKLVHSHCALSTVLTRIRRRGRGNASCSWVCAHVLCVRCTNAPCMETLVCALHACAARGERLPSMSHMSPRASSLPPMPELAPRSKGRCCKSGLHDKSGKEWQRLCELLTPVGYSRCLEYLATEPRRCTTKNKADFPQQH